MNFKRRNKSFTKKRSRDLLLDTWGRKSHKSNKIHELVKKEKIII